MQKHEGALDRHVVVAKLGWNQSAAAGHEIRQRLERCFGIVRFGPEFDPVDHEPRNAELS